MKTGKKSAGHVTRTLMFFIDGLVELGDAIDVKSE